MNDTTVGLASEVETYEVGGVRMARPFKIRRFGHLGFNLDRLDEAVTFYTDELGFRVTDDVSLFELLDGPALEQARRIVTNPCMVFTSNSSDHHALLLAHKTFGSVSGSDAVAADTTVSQITWQVGTLDEVLDGADYLRRRNVPIVRVGRDMPGSNWHVYFLDPDGNTVELYYGMEQTGWDRTSKPGPMHDRAFGTAPPRPQMSEAAEVREAQDRGIDIHSGWRPSESHLNEKYDVGGILLPRPFKVTGLGPFSLFTDGLDVMVEFYTRVLGLQRTEETRYDGYRIVYLRHGTEHHSMVLADKALRAGLGLNPGASCLSVGMQVGSYRQLLDAVDYFGSRGRPIVDLPPELHRGIDYAAYVHDPDGHLIQLYYSIEQLGWDGRPRPPRLRPSITRSWPDAVDTQPETFVGPAFLGPPRVTGYDCDVLVVGAGPVGQITALLLAERGLRVIVLERWDQPYPLPRAVALAHDVLRVLHSLGLGARLAGLLDPWGQEGHEFLLESADGEPLAEAHYSLDSLSGFPEMSGFSQPDLELVLEDRVNAAAAVDQRRGVTVRSLRVVGDEVHVLAVDRDGTETTVSAPYVVGCDGANSTVRDQIGAPVTDLRFDRDWMMADVVPHGPLPSSMRYAGQHLDPARPTTFVPAGPNRRRPA